MLLKQNTARNLMVFMTDATDHITGKASLTLTITLSKDGAAFASITPTVTDRGSGWYALALTTSHTDTLGDWALHITGTGADPSDLVRQVVVDLPGATVSVGSIANGAISSATFATGALGAVWDETRAGHTTAGTFGQGVASVQGNVTGSVASVTGAVGSVTGAVGSVTGNVGGNVVGSVASVTGNVGGSVASVTGAVGSVTGNVGGSVASVVGNVGGSVASVVGNVGGSVASVTGAVGSVTGAVGSVAGNVSGSVASVVGNVGGSVGSVASAVSTGALLTGAQSDIRTALGMASANLDTQLATIGTVTNKLDTTFEFFSGAYRFTTAALVNAPTGSGGGGAPTAAQNAAAVWNSLRSSFTLAGSFGEGVASVTGNVGGNVVGSIGSLATQAQADVNAQVDIGLSDAGVTAAVMAKLDQPISSRLAQNTTLIEGYAAVGTQFTMEQGLYMIWSLLAERKLSGLSLVAGRLNHAQSMTFTLDDTTPTTQQRAT